jgi:seryl-tRNA synthetase
MEKTNRRVKKVKPTQETSIFSSSGSDSSCDSNVKRLSRINRKILDKNSEEYKRKRERNNESVRKSRAKTKAKENETLEQIKQLRKENEELENKVKLSEHELKILKDLYHVNIGTTDFDDSEFRFHNCH